MRGERIPTLEAVLGWAKANRRNLVLDLKSGTATWTADQLQRLLDSVRSARMSSRVSLLSFYGAVLVDAEELDPTVRTQWIAGKGWPGAAVAAAKADAVNLDAAELTPRRVRALHQHGVEAFGRVANRPADWRRLRRVGVDGLLTDRSDDYLRWRRR